MGRIDITDGATRPPLSTDVAALRRALEDGGAVERMRRAWGLRVTPTGMVVGRRGPGFEKKR